jgi:ribonucleotide monophosphatase NagD (HAD superfamily)
MNLEDRDARYLMLIGNPDVLTYLMEKIFGDLISNNRIMVGSNLESDLNKEDYAFKSLNDIILYIEKGIPIILKNKDHIYSSLYDLFN